MYSDLCSYSQNLQEINCWNDSEVEAYGGIEHIYTPWT